MGTGRKKGPGGGGAALNFKVVGNPQPANPKDNTIWLNTDVEITGKYFQAEQPEEMAEGEVWISTGTASQVAFNALKKGGTVMVYPINAKQMQGGTLVDVTAKSWQDGQWVDWAVYLYCAGNEYEDLTGGWFTYDWQNRNTLTLTRHETHLNAEYSDAAYGQGWLSTAKQIDLTDIDTIYLTYVLSNGSANVYFVAATGQTGIFEGTSVTTDVPAFLKLPGGSADKNTVALDVSGLSGSYYVKIGGRNGEYYGMGHVEVDIYSISLER